MIQVRVRGLSAESKFFDEEAEAQVLSSRSLLLRLKNPVTIETNIHITVPETSGEGDFRVFWALRYPIGGVFPCGAETLDFKGTLPVPDKPNPEEGVERAAYTWLKCRRCNKTQAISLLDVEPQYLTKGFEISRMCDNCHSDTQWDFAAQDELEPPIPSVDRRGIGRAPLEMKLMVTRWRYGAPAEEICDTLNVSREGAYFLSDQIYEKGEEVEIVLPYQEGHPSIKLPAVIVRIDDTEGSHLRGVAIHIYPKPKA